MTKSRKNRTECTWSANSLRATMRQPARGRAVRSFFSGAGLAATRSAVAVVIGVPGEITVVQRVDVGAAPAEIGEVSARVGDHVEHVAAHVVIGGQHPTRALAGDAA